MDWLCGTYGGMGEHIMVGTCVGTLVQPTTVFNKVFGNIAIAVSMEFYKAICVEVTERDYTILSDFGDPSKPELFWDFNQLLHVANYAELGENTSGIFQAVFQTL